MYNLIVDTPKTATKLIQRGRLQRRITSIPLDAVRRDVISQATIKLAESIVGKENIHHALTLVNYNKEVQPAMEYVFGGMFICTNMKIASKIAFDKRIMRLCVTLDGDVCNPSGTLSGGAAKKGTPKLLAMEEYSKHKVSRQISVRDE